MTKDHWQPDTASDVCSTESCGKSLTGNFFRNRTHCRRCGRIFCYDCCSLQIRLDINANHDPENGYWCRVCKQCFTTRKGYTQEMGPTRSHTKQFKKMRGTGNEKQGLEASRLEMRFEKLQKIYADPSLSTAAKRGLFPLLFPFFPLMLVGLHPFFFFLLLSNREGKNRDQLG